MAGSDLENHSAVDQKPTNTPDVQGVEQKKKTDHSPQKKARRELLFDR